MEDRETPQIPQTYQQRIAEILEQKNGDCAGDHCEGDDPR